MANVWLQPVLTDKAELRRPLCTYGVKNATDNTVIRWLGYDLFSSNFADFVTVLTF